VVVVRTPSGSPVSDAGRPQNILFDGNYLSGGGPTGFYDASKEDWTGSCDGLDVDSCKDVIISNNTVDGIASIGIRVEQTNRAKVIGNTVKETGGTGITFYNECFDGVCVGNTVQNWGRIPPAYAIRSFGGVYYAAQEFPNATLAPLPANPSVTAWFYVWPYALTGVNASTIIAYADTQYYGTTNGILPYRGEAAISVTQGSHKINVVGNNVVGNITTSGGLYNYSSDYGISCIHPGNAPGGQLEAPLNSMITGNGVVDSRVYRIWHPEFADPIHYNTASYDTGTAVYSANRDSSSLIWANNVRFAQDGQLIAKVDAGSTGRSNFQANWVNFPSTQVASADANTLDDYEEGVFDVTLTCASGTATLDFTRMAYTKIGRQVTITGQIQVSAVSTPSGAVTMGNLPFPIVSISQRAQLIASFVRSSNLVGTPAGVVVASSGTGASVSTLTLALFNDNVYTDLGTSLQTNTQLTFNFSYFAAT
jgi:parallel beta-helix repeat protein